MPNTEVEVLRAALAEPITCADIPSSLQSTTEGEEKMTSKAAFKLMYKIWSGFTKFIRSQVRQGRCVSTPRFGCFVPHSNDEEGLACFIPEQDFLEMGGFAYKEDEFNLNPSFESVCDLAHSC